MKLSPAQRKVLEAMAEGTEIRVVYKIRGGISSVEIKGGGCGIKTFDALSKSGLISRKSSGISYATSFWGITDAGTEALKP
jgi:hypothetical protein